MSTSKQLRVALGQTCPLNAKTLYPTKEEDPLESVRANLAGCADFVRKAKEGGAEVACFAEYYLQGILNEGRQVSVSYSPRSSMLISSICRYHLDTWRRASQTWHGNTRLQSRGL